ncbi:Metalloendopeptidase-like membrane protein [Streptomyces ambofaciens ATCC 23877]|uniref:Metalloendopeptidase-like membrane protein n=1 Tax=Streptomyces ambofaciens (strain ATCC 23877 / 3486 / DSM 40053 / JCM 4204 / NBRC 12836 / NRRL B-2516) TaxID=278992 RepID=A0A0K2B1S5_STRA7|nr:peptidoglycan DD-metalloendopeptidase family protein [Streptomyces ambofaciens]AKZ59158.1 Metalloendopeptidase-like membrane protein [Streptomyces ambofaciens ATCC 23877]WNA15351.1 tail length tape measure protein [Streptomyces phage Samy]
MAAGLDIVGTVGVDVVPVAPLFHEKLKAIALPAARSAGEDAGRAFGDAMSRHITVAIPSAINNGGRAARTASTRQGDDNAGAFGRAFKNRLQVAFRSLPRPDVRLSTTGFDADLARVRARMETLSGKRIGIDVDVATAAAEIETIDAQLAALGSRSPNVQVRADIATARAELAAIQRQINDVDRDDVNIKVRANTAQAQASLLALSASLAGIAIIPAIPVLAAGIGAIASAALAAGAGVGAFALAAIPAVQGVTKVIQAKTAAEKEAATATDNGAAASVKAAQNALQMATAQQSLAAAHRNAARSIAQANRQVEDAERALGQAAARAMEQREQAAKAVERAERALADSKRAVQAAERSLIDAQEDATQAQQDLTRARQDAAQKLADLNDELERGKLDERDATLRVREAQEELNRVQREFDAGKATELQLQRAQLAYDQSVQAAAQQKKDYAQLQKDAEAAKKAGVDGSDEVKSASERLADAQQNVRDQLQAVVDAQQNVRDQAEAVADAQTDAARAQVEAAQTVADAQRALSDAVQNAADTQVQAADSITSAERGVEAARLSSIDTTAKAVTKADEYRKALANLTPEQRALYDSLAGPQGLIPAFKEWSKSLQPDVLPIFTRMVNGAKRALPGLTPLVKSTSDGIQEVMDRASADLKEPFWQRFKTGISTAAKPAIEGLGIGFGNVFKGMAGVLEAFFPHMDSISERMQRITKRFADWGTGLRGSKEFEDFLSYAKEMGPFVSETLRKLGAALFDLAKSLEPLSRIILETLGNVADAIRYVAENAPWAIQLLYGLWVATKLWNLAMAMNPIGAVIMGIALLALGLKYLWDNNEGFREVVTAAWNAIRDKTVEIWERYLRPFFEWFGAIVMWLWEHVIRPYIGFLIAYWKQVGEVFKWVWDHWLKPYIDFLIAYWTKVGEVFKWVWDNLLKPYIDFLIAYWLRVGDVLKWVWDHFWRPIIGFIGELIVWWWNNIVKRYFGFVMDILRAVGGVFKWLYDKGVKPHVDFISDKVSWLWNKGLKPAFDKIKEGVRLVGEGFRHAKDAIGKNWGQISNIAKKPVNFLIEWVYTKGIKALFDGVGKYVGMDPLPPGPKLLEAGGTVGDGWGVAKPMKVNRPTAIVGEGNPRYPEFVIPTDPKYRSRAVALHAQAGTQLLEDGGIIGGAWDWTKDTFSDVIGTGIDWAKQAADLMVNPSKIWDRLTKPVLAKVADGVGDSPYGKTLGKLPVKMVGGLRDKLIDAVTSLTAENGGWGGQWQKPVNAGIGTKFGVPGAMWSSGYHTGLDFPAATGTPVKAVANGRVSKAASGGPYGKHVIIDHGGGLQSLYAHLSKIRTTFPKNHNGGSRIGDVGATGNTTGPHLHLEARLNGRAVDPMKYLSGGGGGAAAVGAAQKYAKSILDNYGWGSSQFAPLKKLWEGESNWRWNAENPSSGAYGIPQALPASKMAAAGADWRTNYKTQIRWGLDYIKGRPDYGSPSAAYSKWLARSPHWYDDGGYLQPGLSLVANGTGRPEPVFTGSQWADIRAAKSGGGPATVNAAVRVFVGDREITDIVRTEIDTYDSATATDLNNGRWD